MDEIPTGTWEEFEAWIRTTIGGDFRGKIRPRDNIANREMVAELTSDEILVGQRHFPERAPGVKVGSRDLARFLCIGNCIPRRQSDYGCTPGRKVHSLDAGFRLLSCCLAKRSWALQGCNPTRDNQVRATKMVASPVTNTTGLFSCPHLASFFEPSNTSKNPIVALPMHPQSTHTFL